MKRIRPLFLFALCFLPAACAVGGTAPSSPSTKAAASRSKAEASREKHALSPLESILNIFAAKEETAWSSFDKAASTQWIDPAPVKNSESHEKENSYNRSGILLLSGFGVVDVPNGKVGIDAGIKKSNEGNVDVMLSGDANRVYAISLVKFYASEDYQKIIQQQLQSNAKIKLIVDHCAFNEYSTDKNTQKNKFYEVNVASGLVYAEVFVDEANMDNAAMPGPGTTTFYFYKSKPTQRIISMRCHEL